VSYRYLRDLRDSAHWVNFVPTSPRVHGSVVAHGTPLSDRLPHLTSRATHRQRVRPHQLNAPTSSMPRFRITHPEAAVTPRTPPFHFRAACAHSPCSLPCPLPAPALPALTRRALSLVLSRRSRCPRSLAVLSPLSSPGARTARAHSPCSLPALTRRALSLLLSRRSRCPRSLAVLSPHSTRPANTGLQPRHPQERPAHPTGNPSSLLVLYSSSQSLVQHELAARCNVDHTPTPLRCSLLKP